MGARTCRNRRHAGDRRTTEGPPSRDHADRLINQAAADLVTAREAAGNNPSGAYTLVYDAARKALIALLENEGLRPTSRAGHHGTFLAVQAQLDPPLGRILRPFERMRRRRNEIEYPDFIQAPLTADDVEEDTRAAEGIISLVKRVCEEMSPY